MEWDNENRGKAKEMSEIENRGATKNMVELVRVKSEDKLC